MRLVWTSRPLNWWIDENNVTEHEARIVIIREYSLLFARGRWPVVLLMCDLMCQVSRDGRNLLTSPLWTVTTMTIITPSHLYPDQPRSKITNKTKPPIVQATPNLLTGVTKPRWPVLCLLICSLTVPASPGTLDTPEIKLDWCQVLWNHNPKSKRLHYTNRQTPPCIDKYSKCKMCPTDFHFRLWVILHLYPSQLRILWCSCF